VQAVCVFTVSVIAGRRPHREHDIARAVHRLELKILRQGTFTGHHLHQSATEATLKKTAKGFLGAVTIADDIDRIVSGE
jgi:hypothetical protein